MYSLSIPSDRWIFDRVKTALKLKNVKIVVICIPLPLVYLIIIQKLSTSVTLSISIRQISEVLKQYQNEHTQTALTVTSQYNW